MAVHMDRSLRLPETEYFPEVCRKTGIALHHTVCDDAWTTVELWRKDRTKSGKARRVGTAYLIDRAGTIYEVFDPAAWAFHLGTSWPGDLRIPFERRFIGIEIVSEGGLIEEGGRLYAYDRVSPLLTKPKAEAFDAGTPYRGYRWFDRYEPQQLEALGRLVGELCNRFPIPRVYPEMPFVYYGDALASFEGVIGHAMVRSDKSDPAPDPRLWETLRDVAGLEPVPVQPTARSRAPLTRREIESLFAANARRLNRMEVGAGSLVKALLMSLERRQVYLRLQEPDEGAYAVGYEVVRGDHRQVALLAHALGFKGVTDRLLEVHHA